MLSELEPLLITAAILAALALWVPLLDSCASVVRQRRIPAGLQPVTIARQRPSDAGHAGSWTSTS